MAQPFVLDINLQIQKVLGLDNVKAQLSSVAGSSAQVNVGAQGAAQTAAALGATQVAAASAAQAINNVASAQTKAVATTAATNAAIKTGAGLFDNYANRVGLAFARYSAFVVATATPFAGLAIIGEATQSIIEFDEAMTKLTQILRQPKDEINALREEIIRLSVDTGTSIKDISDAALVLAQAGFLEGPEDFAKFLEPLSKVPLLPTFGSIEEATEGVIAGLSQFADAGLEPIDILDKLTRVADQFAVESEDLVQGLRGAGATFAALGGDIDEFFGIFTAIRSATRENAEIITTSIKTITTRLADPVTVSFLENLGVSVRDAKGELLDFIDIFKNVRAVFEQSTREQQAAIGKQLGGLRNIGRVFAGIENIDVAETVTAVSRASQGAVAESAAVGLTKLSTQIDLLVARFNQLAQSLAEPIFVPFIQGALSVGSAIATVIDIIKPVLPLFVELISLAAGLKIFNVAANSIKGLASALASINLGGIAGLNGLFTGARSQSATGGVVPIGGVGARTVTGAGAAASNLIGSQVGQLGGLLALNLIAGKLSENFEKTDKSVVKLGLGALQTSTTLLGLASIITGKSIFDLFKGLGSIGKTFVGLGALFAISDTFAEQSKINIDELVSKAEKTVNSLDIEISSGSRVGLQNAIAGVVDPIVSVISGAADEFDGSTFTGVFNAFQTRLSDLFSGDLSSAFGLNLSDAVGGNVTLSEQEVQEFIDKIIGNLNPKGASDIITESFNQFGSDFQAGLQGSIEQIIAPFKNLFPNPELISAQIREAIIKKAGGFNILPDLRIKAQLDAAAKLLSDSTKKVTDSLRSFILPQSLNAELLKLAEVVKLTVRSIDSSIESFDSLSSTIGKIETPQLSTDVTPDAVRRSIESGNLDLGGQFDSLSIAAQKILVTQKAVEDFANSLQINLGNLEQKTRGGVKATEVVSQFIEDFLAEAKIPPEAQQAIRSSANLIASDLQQSIVSGNFGIDPDRLKNTVKTALGPFGQVTDQVVTEIEKLLEAQLRLANAANRARDVRAQIDVSESVRPTTILEGLNESLQNLGFVGINASDDLTNAEGSISRLNQSVAISEALFDDLVPAIEKRNRLESELRQATIENASNVDTLKTAFRNASDEVRDIKIAMDLTGKVAEIAAGGIGTLGDELSEFEKRQFQDQANIVRENLGRAVKLLEFDAAAESSKIFKESNQIFSESVRIFKDTIGGFVSNRPAPNEPGGGNLPNTNVSQLPQITSEVQEIFQSQLENQRSFSQNISDAGTAIGLFSKLVSDSIFGTQLLDDAANTSRAGFDANQFKQALNDTIQQISQNNLTDPNIQTNPLAFLGTDIETIKKNLKLTLDQETQSKLLINLSPEAIQLLRPISDQLVKPTSIPGLNTIGPNLIDDDSQSSVFDSQIVSDAITSAANLFGTAIINLQSLIDQSKAISTDTDNVVAQTQQDSPFDDFIKTVGEKISELVAVVQAQTATQEQVASDQEKQEIKIDGLENVQEATVKNSEELASASENISSLTEQLSRTEDAFAKGVNLTLDTVQRVDVNVTGVSEEIENVGQRLEVVARDIAKGIIFNVLDNLEKSAQDTNTAIAFGNAKSVLG